MAKSDLVVIWGTNPVNTQVNVMTHATRARKERGAKIVAVDIYMNGTMAQADLPCAGEARHRWRAGVRGDALPVPRRQGGLGLSRQIHRRAARARSACEDAHDPQWASAITGCPVETIEEIARLIGATKRSFFRLGYGFARSRNGARLDARGVVHSRR